VRAGNLKLKRQISNHSAWIMHASIMKIEDTKIPTQSLILSPKVTLVKKGGPDAQVDSSEPLFY